MKHVNQLLKLVVFFLSMVASASACESKIIENSIQIGFIGCISRESADILIEAIRRSPRDLVVQSEGGDVEAALRVANELHQKNLSIIIRGYCHSSCANYLIPAAKIVTIEGDSTIVYHGDARTSLTAFMDISGNYVDPMLLSKLRELTEAEKRLEEIIPKVALIHFLQSISIGQPNQKFSIKFDGYLYTCKGLGQLLWSPSMQVMRKLKIVDRVVPVNEVMIPEIRFRQFNVAVSMPIHGNSPMELCEKLSTE
ncbi:MAG: hypothetical protein PHS32_08350 [Rhodoferax sp.]|uniref:hypothetical protein n=1 Tax=Rhodoferax sp. TaxID=50421 RepID=UPI00261D940A|nr:hypothetical protein [Rhodoferax sp.]MDD5333743.1 hypothetical protein [Rhodoferax sp.]